MAAAAAARMRAAAASTSAAQVAGDDDSGWRRPGYVPRDASARSRRPEVTVVNSDAVIRMGAFEELSWRGLVQQTTAENMGEVLATPLTDLRRLRSRQRPACTPATWSR